MKHEDMLLMFIFLAVMIVGSILIALGYSAIGIYASLAGLLLFLLGWLVIVARKPKQKGVTVFLMVGLLCAMLLAVPAPVSAKYYYASGRTFYIQPNGNLWWAIETSTQNMTWSWFAPSIIGFPPVGILIDVNIRVWDSAGTIYLARLNSTSGEQWIPFNRTMGWVHIKLSLTYQFVAPVPVLLSDWVELAIWMTNSEPNMRLWHIGGGGKGCTNI